MEAPTREVIPAPLQATISGCYENGEAASSGDELDLWQSSRLAGTCNLSFFCATMQVHRITPGERQRQ